MCTHGCAPALALASLLLAGCGDSGASDAGRDAGTPDAQLPDAFITPPDIPWLADGVPPIEPPAPPIFTPCPDGWREVMPDGSDRVTTCDPYPEGGPLDCPDGEAHFPGEPGCMPIGSPCPAGEWADGLPDDGTVLFVRPGATGGSGTRTSPFGTISNAMAMAGDGTTVALAKGRYDEAVDVRAGVTLQGACVADTILGLTAGGAVITVTTPGVRLRDLSVVDSPAIGVRFLRDTADVRVDGLLVSGATDTAVLLNNGSALVARSLVIRDTTSGRGVTILPGTSGLGPSADLSRVIIEATHSAGIMVSGEGCRLTLSDGVIRDTQPTVGTLADGAGLGVANGGSAELSRVLLQNNHAAGAVADDEGSSLSLSTVVARDTQARESDGEVGVGLGVELGATATASGLWVEGSRTSGVLVTQGSRLTLSDALVRSTESARSDGHFGCGVTVTRGSALNANRVVLTGNRGAGLLGQGPGTQLTLSDVVIRDTDFERRSSTFGYGAALQSGTVAEFTRIVVDHNLELGMFVADEGTDATLVDVTIRDTQPRNTDLAMGRGMEVSYQAHAEVTRGLVEGNRDVGVLTSSDGAMLTMTDVVIRDTLPRACVTSVCAGHPNGMGLAAFNSGSMVVHRFLVTRSDLCAVQLGRDGELDLSTGVVSDNSIGVCLQVDGYDVSRLMNAVLFQENGTTLEATSFPLPEPASPDL